jgi:hypothetical protein
MKFKMYCKYIANKVDLKKLNTPHVTTGQFVWVESKQLYRDINTSLEIKKNTDNMKHREMLHK